MKLNNPSLITGVLAVLLAVGAWYALTEWPSSSTQTPSITMTATSTMELTSSAFAPGGEIPSKYTCEASPPGAVSPPLTIVGIPKEAQSLALIVVDPDVPKALNSEGNFDHWVMFNITPTTTELAEGAGPGIEGNNGAGKLGYTGPCPPGEYQPMRHRYIFTLYALKSELPLAAGASRAEVEKAMQGLVLEKAQLTGTFAKKK